MLGIFPFARQSVRKDFDDRFRRDPVKPDRCFKRPKSVKTQSFDDLIGVY
jgi:hypothetical protein